MRLFTLELSPQWVLLINTLCDIATDFLPKSLTATKLSRLCPTKNRVFRAFALQYASESWSFAPLNFILNAYRITLAEQQLVAPLF